MTREQIEYKRMACLDGTWIPDGDEYLDLLAAAERLLDLEPFIDAAMKHEGECDRWKEVHMAIDAAIDRAEGR